MTTEQQKLWNALVYRIRAARECRSRIRQQDHLKQASLYLNALTDLDAADPSVLTVEEVELIIGAIPLQSGLLGSHAAGGDTSSLLRQLKDFLFDNCDHVERDRNYDWCPRCVIAFTEVLARPSDSDTATAMRSRCVEKVRAMGQQRQIAAGTTGHGSDGYNYSLACAEFAKEVITALEAVTLEQQQEKQS